MSREAHLNEEEYTARVEQMLAGLRDYIEGTYGGLVGDDRRAFYSALLNVLGNLAKNLKLAPSDLLTHVYSVAIGRVLDPSIAQYLFDMMERRLAIDAAVEAAATCTCSACVARRAREAAEAN